MSFSNFKIIMSTVKTRPHTSRHVSTSLEEKWF